MQGKFRDLDIQQRHLNCETLTDGHMSWYRRTVRTSNTGKARDGVSRVEVRKGGNTGRMRV